MMLHQNPSLIDIRCIAHRLALYTSQAPSEVCNSTRSALLISSITLNTHPTVSLNWRPFNISLTLPSKNSVRCTPSVVWYFMRHWKSCIATLLIYLQEYGTNHDPEALGLKKKVLISYFFLKYVKTRPWCVEKFCLPFVNHMTNIANSLHQSITIASGDTSFLFMTILDVISLCNKTIWRDDSNGIKSDLELSHYQHKHSR